MQTSNGFLLMFFSICFYFPTQRGRIFELKENLTEPKDCFDNAISINPNHVASIQHLVRRIK